MIPPEKISLAWLGNLGNVGFNYVKLLHERKINAILFLGKEYVRRYFPGNPEYEYKNALQEKFIMPIKTTYVTEFLKRIGLRSLPHTLSRRIASGYNIVQAQTCWEIIAFKLKQRYEIPYTALATGADLSEVAFADSKTGEAYRQALNAAEHLFLVNIEQFKYLDELNLNRPPCSFLPFNINVSKFPPAENNSTGKIIFYSIAALDWKSTLRRSIKKNDIFFKGFARYISRYDTKNFELWIADWGTDRQATRELIHSLGIDAIVRYIPIGDKPYLYNIIKQVNIVVDQFALGAIGLSALESMALSRPVFAFCEKAFSRRAYGNEIPVINCRTEEDVYNELHNINSDYIQRKSQDVYRWVQENHSEEKIYTELMKVYSRILVRK